MNIDDIAHPAEQTRRNLAAVELALRDLDAVIRRLEEVEQPARSSWIESVLWDRGFLAVTYRRGGATLYGGPEKPVPEWMREVVAKIGGRAVHRLIRGQYPSQRVEAEDVPELRLRMLGGEIDG